MNAVRITRALISVSDKTGIVDFARSLTDYGIEIISTGGTFAALREAGIRVRSVSDITQFPEILDGRVKTLHPAIHAGILAVADNPNHQRQLEQHHIEPIDLIVVNLYPFEQTIARADVSMDDAIEQIDIGGPAMLRAAAKNFKSKTVVVNPERYGQVLAELKNTQGKIGEEIRFELAREVFLHTARYDGVIASYLERIAGEGRRGDVPPMLRLELPLAARLRYGENPHQQGALYGSFFSYFQKLHGKELSFNNIVDIQAAAALVEEFSEPAAAIIKHTNPCGVAEQKTLADAYRRALATDSKSAFGGIVCVNRPLDVRTATLIDTIFTEVVIAPEFPSEVLNILTRKKDRRLLHQLKPVSSESGFDLRSVAGGVILQTADRGGKELPPARIVTKRSPTEEENRALKFAWNVAKHVKSNAIVYATDGALLGVGAGQMSRVDSSRIAAMKAQEAGFDLHGCAVASDAFFPFADGLLEAVKVGATAVIQPGGSIRDEEVIQAADKHGIAMIFTGIRHFRH